MVMRKPSFFYVASGSLFLLFIFSSLCDSLKAQQLTISDFAMFSGNGGAGTTVPSSPGYGVQIGSSITINGGSVGSYTLVQTTGNAAINANIYSGGKVSITNSNIVSGKIAAANSGALSGTILSVGSSATLGGNIDVNGNIVIGGGTVSGTVTHPPGTTYSGPAPAGGNVIGAPTLPTLPALPAITNFPAAGVTNITTTQTIAPGSYGDITLGGNKTITLNGVGIYIFKSVHFSGNSNKFIFDFKNAPTGNFSVYIQGDADFGKLNANMSNGGDASRIYTEIHGIGNTTSIPTYAFIIANGSSGGGSKWMGTVWTPYAGINIGSGTGSSTLTGALWSGTQINFQSGVTFTYAPFTFCNPPNADAGLDKPLDFSPQTTLTGSSTTAGVSFSWQAINGGIITSSPNAATITVSVAGSYVLTVSSAANCLAKDTVVVTSRLKSVIGSELQSIYDNHTTSSPFFVISGDSVMIDVIVNDGYYTSILNLLQTAPYGLTNIISNGTSNFIITGKFPIINLPKLNFLFTEINYCRPYYQGLTNIGLVTSAGDTSIRSYLVRNGYNVNGDGIKVGVISNSYSTITSGTTTPIKTNTAAQDVANGDLPGDTTFPVGGHVVNPNGYNKNVHVLKDYPGQRSDEGRAMLQIIHDVAPGAELYFRTGSVTAGDFAQGIKDLHNAGCNVIVDDITYMTESFLSDGTVANAVDEVTLQGSTYFSAAGNFASKSYENPYVPVPAPAVFAAGTTAHNFGGGDIFQSVSLQPGDYTFVLQWQDGIHSIGQVGTINDLDIYLTPHTDGTSLFGFNRDNTNGDPIEFIPFTVTSPTTTNVLIVNNTIGSNPARIKFIVFRGDITFNEYQTASTIVGQANALGAIAVGAARYDKALPFPGPLVTESFSSTGGTFVNGLPRNKPELVGPDGVNVTVNMGIDYDHNLFPNFFGTSAAAPHAAAVAALIMQGRKKFLDLPVTTPGEIRSLMQSTAVDMGTPGFDFTSGYGFINADLAMRTFAAPTPAINKLVVPLTSPLTIPGDAVFTVTVKGENFSSNSIVYFNDSALASTIILNTNEATALIPKFDGNPAIRVYTPPYPTTNGLDGGFSNSLHFFEADIIITALNATKKYEETLPALDTTITINGKLLQDTTLTLADIGLSNMTLTTPATKTSDVGTYLITPSRIFDPTNPVDIALLEKYKYTFITGNLTIQKLPLKITAQNSTVNYGDKIPNTQFTYHFIGTYNIPDSSILLNAIASAHQTQLAKDALGNDILGLVNGQAVTIENGQAVTIENGQAVTIENGQAVTIENGIEVPVINAQALTIVNGVVTAINEIKLDTSQISNLSFLATEPSLQNARAIPDQTLINGVYVAGTTNVVDITQESILDYNVNAAQTYMLSSVSNVDPKGLVDILSYTNGQAVTIENGQAVTIENGVEITTVNGQAVTIENGQAVTIENGVPVPIVSSHNRTAVIVDQNEIGDGLAQLKSLNIITGLSVGQQFLIPGSLSNNNYEITYKAGIVTINNPPCLVTHSPDKNFGSSANPGTATSVWLNVVTKISGQLKCKGDYFLFKSGTITLNNIISTPLVIDFAIPPGKIVADNVSIPFTIYDAASNTWITKVPVGFSSTSDIFITGAIINSSTGFVKNNNANSIVKGMFYSNKNNFKDQWSYATAAYQPEFTYASVADSGEVTSINGNYRAGTPTTQIQNLVNGGSGGGGNNYTGSTNSYEKITACVSEGPSCSPSASQVTSSSPIPEELPNTLSAEGVQIIPNPATNYITLSFVPARTGNSKIVLFTLDGKMVFDMDNGICESGKRYLKKIDVSKLINGVYVIQLRSKDQITIKKIIISR
jgi:Subtilase family/Secretion system C-terminal sorting domain/MBG domain (YGX type)